MGADLLIRHAEASFGEWLESQPGRPHILLDPSDAQHGPAGRLLLLKDGKVVAIRFYGSLDSLRHPHVIVSSLASFLAICEAPIIEAPPYRPIPLLRHLLQQIAFLVKPDRIIVAHGTEISLAGWPVGPETIEAPAAFPRMVRDAQRKAQWLRAIEASRRHEIPLADVSIEGARLGSSVPITRQINLPDILHAEVSGSNLLLVAHGELPDAAVAQALDLAHANRATIVHPDDYRRLLCAFVRESGEEFGFGMIEEIDFENQIIVAMADAVPPVPVRIVRIGTLRVSADGRELPEAKPWQL